MAGDERSVEEIVRQLDPDVLERIMVTAGVRSGDDEPPDLNAWGFARTVPSLMGFYKGADLRAEPGAPEHGAYAHLTPGSIVWGHVVKSAAKHVEIEIEAVVAYDLEGVAPKRWRFPEGDRVVASCSVAEPNALSAGAPVRAFVLEVRPGSSQVYLTMREADLPGENRLWPPRSTRDSGPRLGKAPDAPPPPPDPKALRAARRGDATSFTDWLARDPDFHSLHAAPAMQRAYGIQEGWSVSRGWTHRGDPAAAAAVDGMLQNDIKPATRAAWAVDTVRRARACYEKQDYDAAIKFCEQAMDLDASYVASYTLRGAALAKKRKYGDACRDFRTALKLDPANDNARRYLERIEKEHPQSSGKVSMMGGSGRPGVSGDAAERRDGTGKASPERDSDVGPSARYKEALEREIAAEVERERERRREKRERDDGRDGKRDKRHRRDRDDRDRDDRDRDDTRR